MDLFDSEMFLVKPGPVGFSEDVLFFVNGLLKKSYRHVSIDRSF